RTITLIFEVEIRSVSESALHGERPPEDTLRTFQSDDPKKTYGWTSISIRPQVIYLAYTKDELDGSADEIEKALLKKSLSKESITKIKEIYLSMPSKARIAFQSHELEARLLAFCELPNALDPQEFYKSKVFRSFTLGGAI